MRAGNRLGAVFAFGVDRDRPIRAGDFDCLVAFQNGDAFLANRIDGDLGVICLRAGHGAAHFDDGDFRAQAMEGLRHFHADRAATENDKMLWLLWQ